MQRFILLAAFYVLSFIKGYAQDAHSITINFKGLEANKGDVYVALYNTEASFLKTPFKGVIVKVNNLKATAVFENIPAGEYAISAFHDENDNKKMDTRIFGIPKEPIAISNDAKGFMGPPKYNDAKFTVYEDKNLTVKFN